MHVGKKGGTGGAVAQLRSGVPENYQGALNLSTLPKYISANRKKAFGNGFQTPRHTSQGVQ